MIPGCGELSLFVRRNVIILWKVLDFRLMGAFGDKVPSLTVGQPFRT